MYDFARTQSHDDLGTRRICHFCVQDCILATGVLQQGTCALCFYCTVVRESLPLQHLAERVHEILQEHFNVTRHEPSDLESAMIRHGLIDFWERPGESVDAIIAEIADVDAAIANDVGTLLCQRYDQDGSDPLYGRDVRYLEREADATCFRNAWADLARSKEVLNTILSGLSTDRAFPQDTKVIREIGPNDEDRFVWRARVAQSHAEIEAIMKAPVRELGPPPAQNAPAGRMNERGCPVLYGAFDEHTCVAEVRAPVGSHVAVAKFELLRPVLLLDLDALADVYVVGVSHFDPDYSILQARAEFLRSLVRDISRPVMPKDEQSEYAPTQAMAHYLATEFDSGVYEHQGIDGIIYRSSQTRGTGRNLVLFNHARAVEPHTLSDRIDSECHLRPATGESPGHEYERITIYERESSTTHASEIAPDIPALDDRRAAKTDKPCRCHPPTLRLDLNSVYLLNVQSVHYECTRCAVDRIPSEDVNEDAGF